MFTSYLAPEMRYQATPGFISVLGSFFPPPFCPVTGFEGIVGPEAGPRVLQGTGTTESGFMLQGITRSIPG